MQVPPDAAPVPFRIDVSVPVLVLKMGRYPVHHGTLGIVRSLGTLGVPVYAVVEDRLTPSAMSRHLAGAFVCDTADVHTGRLLHRLSRIADRIGRPAILVPTDDAAAAFIAENTEALSKRFLFPRVPSGLPRRLSNKKELYFLCKTFGVPCPETAFPRCLKDVHAFLEATRFPVVVKAAETQRLPPGVPSVTVAADAAELLEIYQRAENPDAVNLILQEYIPQSCAEDWIFHGYRNPETGCSVGFTGKKIRSYPVSAGPTALGVSVANPSLVSQTTRFLDEIGYAGILDIDYRLDKRTGQYLLLDFNPRIGANFRMFEDRPPLKGAPIDVVRALHLDLTGRSVPQYPMAEGRVLVVEHYDARAGLRLLLARKLTPSGWWRTLRGNRELAWFQATDPVPFLAMAVRLLVRGLGLLARRSSPRRRRSQPADAANPKAMTTTGHR